VGLCEPGFADGFIWGEALERLEPAAEVVGGDEVGEVLAQLFVALVVVALDRCLLDRPVHPLDLTIRPRVTRFGQPMFDVEVGAGRFEGMAAEGQLLRPHLPDVLRRPAIAGRIGEVRAVVGEHRVDLVGHCSSKSPKEVTGDAPGRFLVQLDEGELGRAINGYQQVETALLGTDLGDVDVEVAERVALELAPDGRVAFDLRQLRDAVALETAVQRRARQVRDRGLQGVEAVVQRKQRVPAEGDDHRLILDRQHGGSGDLGAGRQIGGGGPLLPLGDVFWLIP
jgi:hypothetical protein